MEISEPSSVLPASTRGSVLIVEDNPLNMKLFSAMVASQGYDVLQASDGLAALDLAHQQHPDRPAQSKRTQGHRTASRNTSSSVACTGVHS